MPNFSGVWNLKEQIQAIAAGRWTGVPTFELYMWGSNYAGAVGDDSTSDRSSPVQLAGEDWSVVSTASHSAAVKTDGSLWAWGPNTNGQLGQSDTVARSSPAQVGSLTNWKSVEVGNQSNFAIKTNNSLWAWGWGNSGRHGLNSTVNVSSPMQIGSLTNWAKVASSNASSLAVKTDGTLWAWGGNASGVLGDGTVINRSSPVQIGALTAWAGITCGTHSMAVKTDGTLWTWGLNSHGQLGRNTRSTIYVPQDLSSPTQLGVLTTWSRVSGGNSSSFAITSSGTMWAWGLNSSGQLGLNDITSRSSPVQIGALSTWSKISSRFSGINCAAIKTDGTLWAWGNNGSGQLGDGTVVNKSSPVQIGVLTSWSGISVGSSPAALLEGTTN